MQCPHCQSTEIRKNGRIRGNQRYRCKNCGRQFMQSTALPDSVTVASNGHLAAVSTTAEKLLPSAIPDAFQKIIPISQQGISVLLLDAENLNKFDANIENFLSELCTYPLQVKIAFANWKHTTGDTELYERGYQLIHVPLGKNSADAQMIAVGAAISRHYREAKEVFVCSSDWLLTHLCNELQSQGLIVYRVRKQNHALAVENRQTGDIKHYSLSLHSEIPSYEGLVKQIQAIFNAERESIEQRLTKLSAVTNLFQERCNLTINDSLATEQEENPITPNINNLSTQPISTPLNTSTINSAVVLENVLIDMIKTISLESGIDNVSVNHLKTQFLIQYKETADTIVKFFQPKSSLIKFLKTNPRIFHLTLVNREHYVNLVHHLVTDIKSSANLEQVILDILKFLKIRLSQKYIPIEVLESDFVKQYGVNITTVMKQLKMKGSSLEFLQSCKTFKVEKSGTIYQVALT